MNIAELRASVPVWLADPDVPWPHKRARLARLMLADGLGRSTRAEQLVREQRLLRGAVAQYERAIKLAASDPVGSAAAHDDAERVYEQITAAAHGAIFAVLARPGIDAQLRAYAEQHWPSLLPPNE